MYRAGEVITQKFALRDPATGTRLTSGTFTVVARDAAGSDISSSIVPVVDGTAAGIYVYTFTPQVEGTYFISIYESTTQQYIDSEFKVGGSLEDRIWNLANQGQTIALSAGGGAITYQGTLTQSGIPLVGSTIHVYAAQDPASGGSDQSAVVDIQTLIAQTTSDITGHFTLSLASGYYALQYSNGAVWSTSYIRWSSSRQSWVTSSSPILPSQL